VGGGGWLGIIAGDSSGGGWWSQHASLAGTLVLDRQQHSSDQHLIDDVSTCRLLAGKKRFGVGVGTRNNQSHCTTVRSRETSIAQN